MKLIAFRKVNEKQEYESLLIKQDKCSSCRTKEKRSDPMIASLDRRFSTELREQVGKMPGGACYTFNCNNHLSSAYSPTPETESV